MVDTDIADLIQAELAPRDDGDHPERPDRTVTDLATALNVPPDRLGERMELVGAVDGLRNDGLVEMGREGEDPSFVCTDSGVERALAVRSDLAGTRVTLVDDGRHDLTLAEAADRVDRALTGVAAALSPDDVYYVEETPEERVVGRSAERERCRETIDAVADTDDGRALFLTGPGGVGKTALARALLDDVRAAGLDVAAARCRGVDGEPFQAVRDVLAAVGVDIAPLPDGGTRTDDAEGFQAQQTALFHEFTLGLTPGPDDPVRVVFFDDLHLADAGTLAYVESLLDRLAGRRLVVLGSYRPSELSNEAGDRFGGDADHVSTVHLDPLDDTATRAVIEQTVGRRSAPDAFVAAIQTLTGGNPLFVEETVNVLLETDQLDPSFRWYPEDAADLDVPDAVRETIDRRVRALPSDARELLQWAALVGDHVPLGVLERVVGEDESLDPTVAVLVGADLFERVGPDAVSFRSEVVREALTGGLPAAERRERHRAIAEAFDAESTAPGGDTTLDARAAIVADHYDRAGQSSAAVEWYRRAGDHAMDVYARSAAVDHYASALGLARETDDDRTVLAVNERLAELSLLGSAFDRAERHVRFVRERSTDAKQRQRVAALAAEIANDRGEFRTAIDHVEEGLSLDERPSRERCRLLGHRAEALSETGEMGPARDAATEMAGIASDLDDRGLVLEAQQLLGTIEVRDSNYDAARDRYHRARRLAQETGDRYQTASILNALGVIAMRSGDLTTGRTYWEAALERFEDLGIPQETAKTRGNLGIVAHRTGDYETATDYYRDAVEVFERIGDRAGTARQRVMLGTTAVEREAYDTARDQYERALETFEGISLRREAAMTRNNLGRVAYELGEYRDGRDYCRTALATFEDLEDPHGIAESNLFLGRIELAEAAYETAREHTQAALDGLQSVGAEDAAALARVELGRIDAATGNPERAVDHWLAAVETYERLEQVGDTLETLERLVDLADERDDPERATAWCRRALGVLSGTGDGAFADRRGWFERRLAALEAADDPR